MKRKFDIVEMFAVISVFATIGFLVTAGITPHLASYHEIGMTRQMAHLLWEADTYRYAMAGRSLLIIAFLSFVLALTTNQLQKIN